MDFLVQHISGVVSKLRVLIVSDDPLARAGLGSLLGGHENLSIVGQISTQDLNQEALEVYLPQVLIWDIGWEVGDTNSHTRLQVWDDFNVLGEALPLVVLVSDEEQVLEAHTAGAKGILSRDLSGSALVSALVAASQGLRVVDPEFESRLFPTIERSLSEPNEQLTSREMEVLRLLAEGFPNKTIAVQLEVSEHTVKFHVNSIFRKLGAQSRTDAVVRATRLGLLML